MDDEDFEIGTDSNGEKFDVIIPNPNVIGLDDALDINFIQRSTRRTVSLNKEGFFRFLETLGFEIGKQRQQNPEVIKFAVPELWYSEFEAGIRGDTGIIAG